MKFIATADWQLGMTARFFDDAARARFHQARLDAVTRIGEVVRETQAAFVVVGGEGGPEGAHPHPRRTGGDLRSGGRHVLVGGSAVGVLPSSGPL